jgi:hypothetical protein
MLPLRLGAASAFGGARADKIALYVRQSAQDGNHQSPGAGAGVGPRLRQRTELRLRVHDLLDDGRTGRRRWRKTVKSVTDDLSATCWLLCRPLQPPSSSTPALGLRLPGRLSRTDRILPSRTSQLRFPWLLARARPDLTRSMIIARSNSAKTPKI